MQVVQPQINLSANPDEVQAVINMLGKQPTESNCWPLMMKFKTQFETQMVGLASAQAAAQKPPSDQPGPSATAASTAGANNAKGKKGA